ncbi:hypothetical protein FGG08_005099 [Glutinoglossum americanum]|uniref:Uncharacterized protein n=1 Tax=Glutinoglossum americanum TaxID=1670608 RepID=A0A9P8I0Y7_9PEZI|nr:hypothetical protein FGG08_005099 [Glutinoglossum americanum]
MTDATSPAGGISSPNDMSSLSSSGTFSTTFARNLVEDYAKNEHPSDTTSRVLGAFLDHLPLDSLEVIVDDIVNNSKDLQKLAMRYTSTILFPSAVLNASGMAKYIDRVLTDRDELCCLAADGSTQTGLLLMAF